MRALLQRVTEASVSVEGEIVGRIEHGLLVFLGLVPDDDEVGLDWMADRILGLRIFPGDGKPMNRSVVDHSMTVFSSCSGHATTLWPPASSAPTCRWPW